MPVHYRTTISAVGPEVADLLEGGILILFADGAPPELAEVSVLHRVTEGPSEAPPAVGASISIGDLTATLTSIGDLAWKKIAEIGHVVINFDGAREGGRSGELSASPVTDGTLTAAIKVGAVIAISG